MSVWDKRNQTVGGDLVVDLHQLDGQDVLCGRSLSLFGISAHVVFIRVEGGSDGIEQAPTNDPLGWWSALTEAEPEGIFNTVEVPGFPGRYVFFVCPRMR